MDIKKLYTPRSENYLKEGLRFAILNGGILLIGGGAGLGLLYLVNIIRAAGFPLPLPVWLITIGIGIPCFIIWFQYGKAYGYLTGERHIIRGITIAMLGDIPGIGCLYILIKMLPDYIISQEIHRIVLILLSVFVVIMPIFTVLGAVDAKTGRN